jgi:hypothetical protein
MKSAAIDRPRIVPRTKDAAENFVREMTSDKVLLFAMAIEGC